MSYFLSEVKGLMREIDELPSAYNFSLYWHFLFLSSLSAVGISLAILDPVSTLTPFDVGIIARICVGLASVAVLVFSLYVHRRRFSNCIHKVLKKKVSRKELGSERDKWQLNTTISFLKRNSLYDLSTIDRLIRHLDYATRSPVLDSIDELSILIKNCGKVASAVFFIVVGAMVAAVYRFNTSAGDIYI